MEAGNRLMKGEAAKLDFDAESDTICVEQDTFRKQQVAQASAVAAGTVDSVVNIKVSAV